MTFTFLGNNKDYEDWDIFAVIEATDRQVIEIAKALFLSKVTHKAVNYNSVWKYGKFTTMEELLKEVEKDNGNSSWNESYLACKILPISNEDLNSAISWCNREELCEIIESRGIRVIYASRNKRIR